MRHRLKLGDEVHEIWLARGLDNDLLLLGDTWHALPPPSDGAVIATNGNTVHIHAGGRTFTVQFIEPVSSLADDTGASADAVARAPMPGAVLSVAVSVGDKVEQGDPLVVIESMKMETTVRATRDGTVAIVHVVVGGSFERDAALVTLADEA